MHHGKPRPIDRGYSVEACESCLASWTIARLDDNHFAFPNGAKLQYADDYVSYMIDFWSMQLEYARARES